jgi:hypothetical protein
MITPSRTVADGVADQTSRHTLSLPLYQFLTRNI